MVVVPSGRTAYWEPSRPLPLVNAPLKCPVYAQFPRYWTSSVQVNSDFSPATELDIAIQRRSTPITNIQPYNQQSPSHRSHPPTAAWLARRPPPWLPPTGTARSPSPRRRRSLTCRRPVSRPWHGPAPTPCSRRHWSRTCSSNSPCPHSRLPAIWTTSRR